MGTQNSKPEPSWSPARENTKTQTEQGVLMSPEQEWEKTLADGKATMQNTQLTNKVAIGGAMGMVGGMAMAGLSWYLHSHPSNQGKPALLTPKPTHLMDEGCISNFVSLAAYRESNETAYVNALQNVDHLMELQNSIQKYPDQITNAYTLSAKSYLEGCKSNLLELYRSLSSTRHKVAFLQVSKKIEFYADTQFSLIYRATATKRS